MYHVSIQSISIVSISIFFYYCCQIWTAFVCIYELCLQIWVYICPYLCACVCMYFALSNLYWLSNAKFFFFFIASDNIFFSLFVSLAFIITVVNHIASQVIVVVALLLLNSILLCIVLVDSWLSVICIASKQQLFHCSSLNV